jgi:hypothetical protein
VIIWRAVIMQNWKRTNMPNFAGKHYSCLAFNALQLSDMPESNEADLSKNNGAHDMTIVHKLNDRVNS